MAMGYARHSDLISVVYNQLPEGLQGKLSVDVAADAYLLKATATFGDDKGHTWQCQLETCDLEGVPVSCVIPQIFLAELSALV